MNPMMLATRGDMLNKLGLGTSSDSKQKRRKDKPRKNMPLASSSNSSSNASSRSSSRSASKRRTQGQQQISPATLIHRLFGNKPRKRAKSVRIASDIEAEKAAEAAMIKSYQLWTLKNISEARQELMSGSATKQELTSAIDESLDLAVDCTDRMIELSTEAEEAGIKILMALEAQLAQLDNIEDTLGTINYEMHCAEAELENLEKCCGLCVLPWNREPNIEDTDEYVDTWQESLGQTVVTTQPRSSGCKMPPPLVVGEFIIPRVINDEREDVLSDNMHRLSRLAAVLCSISKDINFELVEQTEQCARIIAKAQSLEERILIATERSLKILEGDEDD